MKPPRSSHPGHADLSAEGDVNLSPLRKRWEAEQLAPATRALLAEDAKYFLHQSLSTPCFNALAVGVGHLARRRRGPALHGFPRQQRAPGRPRASARRAGGQGRARHAAVLAAAIHERSGGRARAPARRACAGRPRKGAVRARRHDRDRHGTEARARRHRAAQDDLDVGCVPRRVARRDIDRRRSIVPPRHGAAAARHRARAALRSARLPLRLRRRSATRAAPNTSNTCSTRRRTSQRSSWRPCARPMCRSRRARTTRRCAAHATGTAHF